MPWVRCPVPTSTRPSPSVWLLPGASSGRTLRHTSARRWWPVWWPVVSWSSSPAASRVLPPRATWLPTATGSIPPGGYSLVAALVTEVLLTGFFLYVILGATDTRAPQGFAPIAIGLGLTLIHLISIPIDNTSVNPARSTGVAFFNGNGAPAQLWLFWVAPIIGAAIAGATYAIITGVHREDRDVAGDSRPDWRTTKASRAAPRGLTSIRELAWSAHGQW